MRLEHLTDVFLKQVGARKDGAAFVVPSDAETSLFVGLEGETLAIAKVVRLEVAGALLAADTVKGERYLFAAEDVCAVKIDRGDSARGERLVPGFK